ncbi:MAG: PQQ-binding-like beta-propeller repeat protein [Chloroflexota bacterium]
MHVRLLAAGAVLAIVGGLLLNHSRSGGGEHKRIDAPSAAVLRPRLAKPLPAPISREAVVGLAGGPLIAGGLDSSETSVSGVFQLPLDGGALAPAGSLTGPLHDAAATALGNQVLVFGGGTEASSDEVQALPAAGGSVAASAAAEAVGRLPTVRSDLSAVTVGRRAFVLGGYDGEAPLASILATEDGRSFAQVGTLPEPARYMAVAAENGKIYAFGGETGSGAASGAIREVDARSGSARVVGRLPQPLSHAVALALGGSVYVLGGETGARTTAKIWRFDPAAGKLAPGGKLPFPVANGAAAVVGSTGYLIGGTGSNGTTLREVIELAPGWATPSSPPPSSQPATAGAERPQPPFEGSLLIADRGNNRLLVVNAEKKVLWRFPSKAHPAPPGGFYFPDDAFFTHHGTQLISNEEQNERIVRLAFPSGKLLWSYGHPGVSGSQPGYLHEPDDAYLWRDGTVSVADAQNCRVLIISPAKKVLHQFGEPSRCEHEPPRALGSPNGDTPLRNGDLLVSEVNGSYIDEITRRGKLVWSVQLPIAYPSDPQQLGPDLYLVVDYARPGGIYEFNRAGKILWSYHPSSGHGMLDHPSLAERLPGGLIAVNDDYRHRIAIIDPRTRKIVWQYGRTDSPGRGHDHLNTPDGFDLLSPQGTTPTHPYTG